MWEAIRRWFDPAELCSVGETPDYRFSLANERTFLAWLRTGLALVGGGLAAAQFLPPLPMSHLREVIAVALLLLGGGGRDPRRGPLGAYRTRHPARSGTARVPVPRHPGASPSAPARLLLVVAVLVRAIGGR